MRNKLADDDEQDSGSTLDGIVVLLLPLSCCLLPLALSGLALVSSWMAALNGFASYRPWLAGLAFVCCGFAWRRIYRPVGACGPGQAKRPGIGAKVIFWVLAFAMWDLFGSPLLQGYL